MEFVCGYSGSCFHKADFESGVHAEWMTKEKIIRNRQGGRDGMLQTTLGGSHLGFRIGGRKPELPPWLFQ
jgi:hypothetical protein